jgi:hypothetical protein
MLPTPPVLRSHGAVERLARRLIRGVGTGPVQQRRAVGCTPLAVQQPTRYSGSSGAGTRPSVEVGDACPTRSTRHPRRPARPGPPPGRREPHLGLPAHSRRTRRPRLPDRSLHRLDPPAQRRHRPFTPPSRSDLAPVSAGAGARAQPCGCASDYARARRPRRASATCGSPATTTTCRRTTLRRDGSLPGSPFMGTIGLTPTGRCGGGSRLQTAARQPSPRGRSSSSTTSVRGSACNG